MDPIEQILNELGNIRNPDGKGIKVITDPNAQVYKMLEMLRLQKRGTYSASDPEVVIEARQLAISGGVWIVLKGAEYELFGFRRVH
jgi:hypothetical protein